MIEIHHTPATGALVDAPAPASAQALVDITAVDTANINTAVPAEPAAPQIDEPVDAVTPAAPKPRLTQVERLAKQLAAAEEKAREKARIKLTKTLEELTKAHADVARASARLAKAAADARELQEFVGGVEGDDLILTPEEIESHNAEVRIEEAANDTEYPDDYLTIGHSHASHSRMLAAARAPVEVGSLEEPAAVETVIEELPVEEPVAGDTD